MEASSEQLRAVKHTNSHARLLAGPGTGKTFVLSKKVEHLVLQEHILPASILVLTFTRAAAYELRERISKYIGRERLPEVSTIHSFALKYLLRNSDRINLPLPTPIRIADDWDENRIIYPDIKLLLNYSNITEVHKLFHALSANWDSFVDKPDKPDPRFISVWERHRRVYGYTLRAELVYRLAKALQQYGNEFALPEYKYVLLDEYQDLNPCDLAIADELSKRGAFLFIAGDDDQSIYGFRRAHPEGIRKFTTDYPDAADLTLTECRRCTPEILDLAHWVIRTDLDRIDRPLHSVVDSQGEVRVLRYEDQEKEAKGIAAISKCLINRYGYIPDDILILLRLDRNSSFSTVIKNAFSQQDIPISSNTASLDDPLSTTSGRVLISFLRLLVNSQDHLAWRAILQERRSNNLGPSRISDIYQYAVNNNITFAEALERISIKPALVDSPTGQLIQKEYDFISNLLSHATEIGSVEDIIEYVSIHLFNSITDSARLEELESAAQHMTYLAAELNSPSLVDFLSQIAATNTEIEQERMPGAVNILTMHKAKGLSSRVVFIVGAEDELIPGRSESGNELEDERRLFYVSLTRAREKLYITYSLRRSGAQRFSGRSPRAEVRQITRFLQEAPISPESGPDYLNSLCPSSAS